MFLFAQLKSLKGSYFTLVQYSIDKEKEQGKTLSGSSISI